MKTKMLQIRIPVALLDQIKAEADRLGLKPSEVARLALAQQLRSGLHRIGADGPADRSEQGEARVT